MASYPQGYDEERFVTTINRNFLCLICFNVLRNPVFCPRNEHHFCRACITKFLENSHRCPTCADELTVESLNEPNRMVKDMLNELNIRCKFVYRGCHEIVQLQHLDRHEATCGFTPVVCTNQGCGVTLNKRDQIHHESELCEFRKLKCHSCGEMTKTLADINERVSKMETMKTNMAAIKNKMASIETNVAEFRDEYGRYKNRYGREFEVVNNEVKGLKTALIRGFNEMKEVLVKVEDRKDSSRKAGGGASGDKENIIVVGGVGNNSVEIFYWSQKMWSPLQSLPEGLEVATAFVYKSHVTVTGDYVENTIRMTIEPHPDISTPWRECGVKLPKLALHSSVVYRDQLIVTGGYNKNATSNCIDEVQLVPPYCVKTLSRMPEPRICHSTEIIQDNLLIIGGTTTRSYEDNLNSVILYDIRKNECKQLAPLPYEVGRMATVRWRDNIVVIGGVDKHANVLNTVLIYNVKTEQHHMLPSMKCNRFGYTAVVIRNNIVVLGGWNEQNRDLKSVEAFNFDRYTWEELPEMSKGRSFHSAVVV